MTQTKEIAPVNIAAYTQVDVFEELQGEWNELLQRSITNTVFNTWEWNKHWWDAYQPGQLWMLTCRDVDGRLMGIAPWFIEETQEQGQIVRCIGCEDVTDYMDLIVDRDHTEMVFGCFSQYLAQHLDEFSAIDLCNIPENSPTAQQFPHFLQRCNFNAEVAPQEVCPVITLAEDWDGYLAGLKKKQRHELRRKLRRGDAAPEKLEWYVVDDTHNLDEQIEIFLKLMAASDREKAEFLQDPQHVTFFKTIVPVAYEKGWLQMSFLTVNETPVASYINFDYGNRIMVYNSGLDAQDYGHLSPGILLLAYNIQDAIDKRREAFDFLRGDEVYKYRMGGQDTHVCNLKARPAYASA